MTTVSIFFLLLSICFFVTSKRSLHTSWIYYLLFLLNGTGIVINTIIATFGGDTIYDEFFFHVLAEKKAIVQMSVEYPMILFGITLYLICVATFIVFTIKLKRRKITKNGTVLTFTTIILATITNPFIIASSTFFIDFQSSQHSYTAQTISQLGDGSFGQYYKIPRITEVTEKRNFVFIYLEGFDYGYFDETRFPDLLPNLQSIASQSTVFTNVGQLPGAGSTITGLVSSQCGIPLLTPGIGYAYSARQFGSFLPNATCLGDLLNKKGYELSYYGGAEKSFSNKDVFFSSHGFKNIYGKSELGENLPADYDYSKWGVHDDALFAQILSDIKTISPKQPTGIFALTVDTHVPRGYPSENCQNDYTHNNDKLLDAVACTDQIIGDFVSALQETTFGEDAVVIITSDHLSQTTRLQEGTERRNTLLVFDPRKKTNTTVTTEGATLDTGTTILPFIGMSGQIGLGRNLVEKTAEEHLTIAKKVNRWRKELLFFWDVAETLEGNITISKELSSVTINNKTYETPALISFINENEYKLYLPKYRGGRNFLRKVKSDSQQAYILIDDCNRVFDEKNQWTSTNFKCLRSTSLDKPISGLYVRDDMTITKEDLFK